MLLCYHQNKSIQMKVTIDVRIIIMFLGGSRHDSHHHSQMQLKQGGVTAFLKMFEHQPGPPSVTSRWSMWVYIRSICERFVKIHGPLSLLLFYIYIYNSVLFFHFVYYDIISYNIILIILYFVVLYYIISYDIPFIGHITRISTAKTCSNMYKSV